MKRTVESFTEEGAIVTRQIVGKKLSCDDKLGWCALLFSMVYSFVVFISGYTVLLLLLKYIVSHNRGCRRGVE